MIERIERVKGSPVWISHWLKFTQRVGETGFPKQFVIPVANGNVPWPGRPGKDRLNPEAQKQLDYHHTHQGIKDELQRLEGGREEIHDGGDLPDQRGRGEEQPLDRPEGDREGT